MQRNDGGWMVLGSRWINSAAAGEEELPGIHIALVADCMENSISSADNAIEFGICELGQYIFGVCIHDRLSFRFVFLPRKGFHICDVLSLAILSISRFCVYLQQKVIIVPYRGYGVFVLSTWGDKQ